MELIVKKYGRDVMEIEITKDSKNPLLGRRELEFYIIEDDRTPSKNEIKEKLCKKLNLSPDGTVIVRIDQEFGMKRSKGVANSYEKKEDIQKYEQKRLIKRWSKKPKGAAASSAQQAAEAQAAKEK
jgi:small subunit ribosomal protein S24e